MVIDILGGGLVLVILAVCLTIGPRQVRWLRSKTGDRGLFTTILSGAFLHRQR